MHASLEHVVLLACPEDLPTSSTTAPSASPSSMIPETSATSGTPDPIKRKLTFSEDPPKRLNTLPSFSFGGSPSSSEAGLLNLTCVEVLYVALPFHARPRHKRLEPSA